MRKQSLPLTIEQEKNTALIMIIGEDVPILVEALASYIKKYGGSVVTSFQKKKYVDYLIVFDDRKNLEKYTRMVKPKGKVLHVISSSLLKSKHNNTIATYLLPPTKTYKGSVLVKKILTKLYHAPSFQPNLPTHIPKKSQKKKKEHHITKKQPFKKILKKLQITIISLLIVFTLPIIVWSIAASSAVYSLYQLPHVFNNKEKGIAWAKRAMLFSDIAYSSSKLFSPLIKPLSPQIEDILSSYMTILSSISSASRQSVQYQHTFSLFINSFFSKNSSILTDSAKDIQEKIAFILASLEPAIESTHHLEAYADHPLVKYFSPYRQYIINSYNILSNGHQVLPLLPQLLAVNTRKTYLLLFQNNFELRPTGGFIGSFALVTFEDGKIKDFTIEDVYEADGQLKGGVLPPKPIQIYLNQPHWFLRDSNWNPDFALSARQAEWFLQKELNKQVDGVIALDLYAVKNIINALGNIYVPDYQSYVTADDFFYKLQNDTHDEFFPGSEKKKNLLSSLTGALTIQLEKEIKEKNYPVLFQVINAVNNSFSQKHILLYMHDQKIQSVIEQLNWGGRIVSFQKNTSEDSVPYIADYTLVTDANLGVNKVNKNIIREFYHTISKKDTAIEHSITISYYNKSEKNKKSLYDGIYQNYVRIFIPKYAQIQSVLYQTTPYLKKGIIETYNDKKTIGLFIEVPPQSDKKITLSYSIPINSPDKFTYQLMLQKQPGTYNDTLLIQTDKTTNALIQKSSISSFPFMTTLRHDMLINIDFKR